MGDGTYLEDFISSMEMLPNDVRRDFELVCDLCFGSDGYMFILMRIFYQTKWLTILLLLIIWLWLLPPLLFNFVFAYEKIRDLDRECLELFAELKESEQAYIQRTRSRMIDGKPVKFPNVFSNQGSTLPTSTGCGKDGANGSSKSVAD